MSPNKERNLTIKDWDLTDRPWEKLLQKGVSAFSNAELLAIIIGSGRPGLSAVDLMKNLLSTSEHRLQQLNQKSIAEYTKFDGIGMAKAVKIKAALGLASRFSTEGIFDRPAIQSSARRFSFLETICRLWITSNFGCFISIGLIGRWANCNSAKAVLRKRYWITAFVQTRIRIKCHSHYHGA